MPNLSATQTQLLTQAASHGFQLLTPPPRLPAAARTSVVRSLLQANLVTEINLKHDMKLETWRMDGQTRVGLKITDEGRRAIGIDPNEGDLPPGEPDASGIEGSVPDGIDIRDPALAEQPAAQANAASWDRFTPKAAPKGGRMQALRNAAAALVDAWDAAPGANLDGPMARAIEALRSTLDEPVAERAAPAARQGTKKEAILAMLGRREGATIDQIAAETGWQQHTIRGFFAHLKTAGKPVAPEKAAGQPTVYRLA